MGRLLAALLVGTTGCAQLADIDETTGLPPGVSLAFERVSIGTAVVRAPENLSGHMATYLVADDTAADGLARQPAAQADTNVWVASIYTAPPPVVFTLPDTTMLREWVFPNRDVSGILTVLEHPNPTPAPAGAMLTVSAPLVTPYNGAQSFELFSMGTWTAKGLTPPALGATTLGPQTYPYTDSNVYTGRPLEKITRDDTHLILRYEGGSLTGVAEPPPFEQTGTDVVTATLADAPRDQTLDVRLDPAGTPNRFATQLPPMATVSMNWWLRASPGSTVGVEAGPVLHGGSVGATSPAALVVTYANPFAARGWASTFAFDAAASRTYTAPGMMLGVTVIAGLTQIIEAASAPAEMPIDIAVGMPQTIAIDGVPLLTDGVSIPKPRRAPTITFETDRIDNALYEVVVIEIAPNAGGTALQRRAVIAATGVQPSFVIPTEMFEVGKMYTIRAATYAGGFPTVAAGDLTNRSLPLNRAYYESGVFTVTP